MTGARPVALRFDNVTKTFRTAQRDIVALKDLSVSVAAGGVTGLIGPDGAGKTTLMRLASALLRPDAGSVTVLGLDARRQALEIQSRIGYMPQRFGLYEDLTVQENLDLYADLQGVPTRERPQRYKELMQMAGLSPFMRRLAGKLSGGMKQKLGLACTLVHPPELLLLDEPTVGVDPVSRRELWSIIERFVKEEKTTVLLSTAYLDEAERCDEVIVLDEGELIGQGAPTEFSRPMRGRTFRIQVPGRSNREIQEQLATQPGVIDAVIQGDAVRLVLAEEPGEHVHRVVAGMAGARIDPVPPRFEDGFIAALRARRRPAIRAERGNHEFVPKRTASDVGPVVTVRNVKRRFGDFYAVKGVSFDVRRGEIFGLLGANGAGKTTVFRMLCGLLPASEGSLRVAGVDVRKTAAAARARIGYMSQKFSLYGTLSVADNLAFFSGAYGLAGRRRKQRMQWAVDQFQLAPVLDVASGDLPIGYKQRLALACALMHEPEIIFLDEPTSGVDPLARREFWHRINVMATAGVTVLVTTHFMEEAEYCDRVVIMGEGRILAFGTPSEIKQIARTADNPQPTMEDAFIRLIESHQQVAAAAGSQEMRPSP